MHRVIAFAFFVALVHCRPQKEIVFPRGPGQGQLKSLLAEEEYRKDITRPIQPSDYELYQNEHARYQFSTDIDDHINDQTQQRTETRDGSTVKGSYSYSDGYYKRTVHYEADKNGYRVTGTETVPLDGPHVDLSGTASVSSAAHGTSVSYKIASIEVPGPVAKIVDNPQYYEQHL